MAPSGKRILIGCGVGCAVVVAVVIAGAIGFGVWLNSPGELLEPDRLLGSDTTAYAEVTLSLDDPKTAAFVDLLIDRVQNLSPAELGSLPGWFSTWQQRKTRRDIEKLFPLVAAWTLHPGDGSDEDLQLVSLSLQRASHQFVLTDWILSWFIGHDRQTKRHVHGRENIYQFVLGSEFELTFFIHRGDVFFTSDLATAKQAVDRLEAPDTATRESTELERMFAPVPGAPVRAALTNRRGEIARVWKMLAVDSGSSLDLQVWNSLDSLQGLIASAALEPDGSLQASFELLCPDAAFARSHTAILIDALERSLPQFGLQSTVTGEARGQKLRLQVRVDNLIEALERTVDAGDPIRIRTRSESD